MTIGVLLAIVSLGVLIYFIHHVSVSIQADEVVARVYGELIHGIDRLFPESMGCGDPRPAAESASARVRTLSPGINDPFTAITCVDRLGSALHRLAQREMPSPFRLDEQDRLRVVAPAATFAEIVGASFGPIRQYARSSAVVTIRLLQTIAVIAGATHRPTDRAALLRQAEMIVRGAREALPEDGDRQAVEECYRDASHALSSVCVRRWQTEARFPT